MRLLRIDGTVLVSPARVVNDPPVMPEATEPVSLQERLPAPTGAELAEAARLLRESTEVLARAGARELR